MRLNKVIQDPKYLLTSGPARDLFAQQEVLQNGTFPRVATSAISRAVLASQLISQSELTATKSPQKLRPVI